MLIAASLASGCGRVDEGGGGNATSGLVKEYPAPQRVRLTPISGTTLDGVSISTSDLAGAVLVLNVWGSWCAPCRTEAPALARLSRETREHGGQKSDSPVAFLGINVKDNDAAAIAFEQRYGINYPSVNTATSDQALLAIASVVPDNAVPSTVVVDAQGRVAARVIGAVDYSTLSGLVADA